jgi:hypothetical protein
VSDREAEPTEAPEELVDGVQGYLGHKTSPVSLASYFLLWASKAMGVKWARWCLHVLPAPVGKKGINAFGPGAPGPTCTKLLMIPPHSESGLCRRTGLT